MIFSFTRGFIDTPLRDPISAVLGGAGILTADDFGPFTDDPLAAKEIDCESEVGLIGWNERFES